LEDNAIATGSTAAHRIALHDETLQATFERFEFSQPGLYLPQVPSGYVANLAAVLVGADGQAGEQAHLLDAEAEVAATPDEGKPLKVIGAIDALTSS
jgi:hypothetical protein